jgi:hypothetical protein
MEYLLATFVTAGRYQPQTPELDSLGEVESTDSAQVVKDPSLPVKGMYRLLDLITEQGSSGLGNPVFPYQLYLH